MYKHSQLFQIIFVPILFQDSSCGSFRQKKGKKDLKENQLLFFKYSGKYLKGACLHKCLLFLTNSCQNNNVPSGKVTVHNNVIYLC